jgi:hypothetical protein
MLQPEREPSPRRARSAALSMASPFASANREPELHLPLTFDTILRFACHGSSDLGPAANNRRIP